MFISREIVCQRHWHRLATRHAGVAKLPDYLRIDKKGGNQTKNPLSLSAVQFGVHKSTDGPIENYCSCWCHLSKLKVAAPTPNLSEWVYTCRLQRTTPPLLFRMEFYSDQVIVFRMRRIYDHFIFRLSCSSTCNRIRSVHVNTSSLIHIVHFLLKGWIIPHSAASRDIDCPCYMYPKHIVWPCIFCWHKHKSI